MGPVRSEVTIIGDYSVFTINHQGHFSTEFRLGEKLLFGMDGVLSEHDKKKHLGEWLATSPEYK